MDFSEKTLRARFRELTAQREAIDVKLDPLRAQVDALVAGKVDISLADAQALEATTRDQIKELQAELHPIENERAAVARALGGKTSEPVEPGDTVEQS